MTKIMDFCEDQTCETLKNMGMLETKEKFTLQCDGLGSFTNLNVLARIKNVAVTADIISYKRTLLVPILELKYSLSLRI